MTYQGAIQFLYELRWFGAKFGLENTLKLAEMAGNPQNSLRFIHVAGTNGKGSTCAMLESIYRAAGLKVGLFTSPHLVAFGERIQVQRQLIPEAAVVRLVAEMKGLLQRGWGAGTDEHPTFFEVVTVMALRYFQEQRCELVIWETGLGGRLDASNIVTPLASVITNIQYDHQKWLGETLASIAAEKAGIIKPGIPVATGAEEPEALKVIQDTAHRQNSALVEVTAADVKLPPLDRLELPLLGRHQKMNAAVALAAVQTLQAKIPVSEAAIHFGLSQVHWPGRLQLVTLSDGRKVLLDGAHNSSGAEILAAALKEYFPGVRPTLVLGILRDKDWAAMCRTLSPLASRVLLVPVHSERTAEPHGLAEVCHQANPNVHVGDYASLSEALADTTRDGFIAVAGSLYLIGEAMEVLGLSTLTASGERDLNEWGAQPPSAKAAK